MKTTRDNKKIKGITLIALVITIIVLLILAGVSINMITGENSMLSKAGEARNNTEMATAKDNIYLAWTACTTECYLNEKTPEEAYTKENINSYLDGKGEVTDLVYNSRGTSAIVYRYKNNDYTFELSSSGNMNAGGESSMANATKGLNRQKLDDLYNKGWSVGETSTGYFAADYANMKLYTLDASVNTVSEDTLTLTLSDESLFTVNSDGIITATTATGAVVIPKTIGGNTVVGIAASAFKSKTTITRVIIPPTVTAINNGTSTSTGAFCGCTGLTTIDIPAGITTIAASAFYNCNKVATVYIRGTSLTSVGKSAFVSLKSGSVIHVGNSTISSLFTSNNYTTSKTTIEVDSSML